MLGIMNLENLDELQDIFDIYRRSLLKKIKNIQ